MDTTEPTLNDDEILQQAIEDYYPNGWPRKSVGELSMSESDTVHLRSFWLLLSLQCRVPVVRMDLQKWPDFLEIFNSATSTGNFGDVRQYLKARLSKAVSRDNDTGALALNENAVTPNYASMQATLDSFTEPYQGAASDKLYEQLKAYLKLPQDRFYARCIPIIQSSGTGKSRMVDELAKRVITANVNLSTVLDVFPPPDRDIRNFLTGPSEQSIAALTMQAYLYATLKVAKDFIIAIPEYRSTALYAKDEQSVANRIAVLASIFREKMREGQTFAKHGEYHTKFYAEVRKVADKFIKDATNEGLLDAVATASPNFGQGDRSLEFVSKDLCDIFDIDNETRGMVPFFVFTFDEAHSLAQARLEHGDSSPPLAWSLFSELRRALRGLRNQPFFSIFLSTNGKLEYFAPNPRHDPSYRLASEFLVAFDPYFETGFGQLAQKVDAEFPTPLRHVVSDEFIAYIGRPLFAARYHHGNEHVKKGILNFAVEKLICGDFPLTSEGSTLDNAQMLACLAVRLPLEFMSTTWSKGDVERTQVERHMRLCISSTSGLTKILTNAPSEPLLAEASYTLMNEIGFDVPAALNNHLASSNLCKGERGELIASLILLLARDAVVGQNPVNASSSGSHRIISVPEFLKALFNPEDYQKILEAKSATASESPPLEEAFKNSKIYFNHLVKAGHHSMTRQENLWATMVRGAALVCANNQEGIDIVIPVLHNSNILQPTHISCILIQVKNGVTFTSAPKWTLCDLDPFSLSIFKKTTTLTTPPSVIRIVFALAATVEPHADSVTVRAAPEKRSTRVETPMFHGYDIWCAGCTSATFRVVTERQEATFRDLLDHTHSNTMPFTKTKKDNIDRHLTRRLMWPLFAPDSEHLYPCTGFEEEVQKIAESAKRKAKKVASAFSMDVDEKD